MYERQRLFTNWACGKVDMDMTVIWIPGVAEGRNIPACLMDKKMVRGSCLACHS